MSRLLIAPYSAVEQTVRRHRPSHLLTVLDVPVETPPSVKPERHLRICMHDVCEPSPEALAPSEDHIADILAFARGWDRSAPLLVHCWAGISRSTAAAFIVLCDMHGPYHEQAIAQGLRFRAPHAQPNRLMIHHADQLMGREGRMIAAVESMGAARIVYEGDVAELPLTLEEL